MLSLTREELIAGDGVLGDVEDTPERLERAKRALEGLDGFGLQPRFEVFCRELDDPVRRRPRRTDSIERDGSVPASKRLARRIARDNALDVELYEFARHCTTNATIAANGFVMVSAPRQLDAVASSRS